MFARSSRLFGLLLPSLVAAAVPVDIETALGPNLSDKAEIIWPSDAAFSEATDRWSSYHAPTAGVVVSAGTPEDVRLTVAYALNTSTPFLTRNTGHGTSYSLGTFDGGILINIGTLDHIAVDASAMTVTFGGGIYNGELITAVSDAGLETTTGSCSCVGLLGAGLGGGHGRLQGRHGLITDQILSVKLVTSDARLITVSETENSELLWALKGAGHNYGIVVEATSRLYEPTTDAWTVVTWTLPSKAVAVEGMVRIMNSFADNHADDELLTFFMNYQVNPETLQVEVAVNLVYAGPAAEVQSYIDSVEELGPIEPGQVEIVPWARVNDAAGAGVDSIICTSRGRKNQYSTSILRYDAATQVEILNKLQALIDDNPALGAGASIIFESYPLKAFQEIPHDSTAYGNRDANIIALFGAYYEDPDLDAVAHEFGVWFRQKMAETGGFNGRKVVYVNYAQGDETLEEMYGVEPWRVKRLETLKKKWDPKSFFGYYNPIPAGGK